MLNSDMYRLGSAPSAIRELFEYGKKLRIERGSENVFDFSLGNPSTPPPKSVLDAMETILKQTEPCALHGYSSAQGDALVRKAISDDLAKRYGAKISPDKIYMTCGAAASLCITIRALVCGENNEFIAQAPFFPEYRVFVEGVGAKVVEVECRRSDFHPDVTAIANAITERTAAIIVNSPNNPTGAVYTADEISEIADVLNAAAEKYGHPIYLIADEPYRELVYGGAVVPFIPSLYKNTVVCYSFSKSLSIPGERIGYVLVPRDMQDKVAVYDAIAGAARSFGYVCAPSLLQKMLPAVLGMTADITVYDGNRQVLYTELTRLGFDMIAPDGAFYMFMKSPIPDAGEFCEAAKRHDLLLVPSDSFGIGGYVRISYCVDSEMIKRSLPAFAALAAEYRQGD